MDHLQNLSLADRCFLIFFGYFFFIGLTSGYRKNALRLCRSVFSRATCCADPEDLWESLFSLSATAQLQLSVGHRFASLPVCHHCWLCACPWGLVMFWSDFYMGWLRQTVLLNNIRGLYRVFDLWNGLMELSEDKLNALYCREQSDDHLHIINVTNRHIKLYTALTSSLDPFFNKS